MEMLRFFLLLLCVSPCLLTQTTESEKSGCHGNSSKPHDWSTTSCVTDDECDDTNAVCYVDKCRCRPGLFFSATYTCSDTCSTEDLHNTFMEYPNSGLKGHILEVRAGLCLEDCKKLCLKNQRCLTFDYRAVRGLCVLHDVTALESPSEWYPKTSKGWTHYQRSCLTQFASYPVWHNLLCNNDLDCPDPYSHCLTGRCVCSSGTVFRKNEAACRVTEESCQSWKEDGGETGVHSIQMADNKENLTVWCDMDSNGGGWLVFQRRRDGSVDFYRNWTDYENGFGDVTGKFWLGLSRLHRLTKDKPARLRVDLRDVNGESYYAEYSSFSVGGPETNYRLTVSTYSPEAMRFLSDGMAYHNSQSFSTYDRDNDKYPGNCAAEFHGAWWFNTCFNSDLNGRYKANGATGTDGITWTNIHYDDRSFTFSEMKLRPA
ncbi:ficolin-1-like [Pomacea canaliculata]|uniref:ficolin-1-like n=1 Tax=Pomacea canaliculata TaxID=400727 RepID=UPI000D73F119|nr:ficolin-1-like [Pomacea canaliculata]